MPNPQRKTAILGLTGTAIAANGAWMIADPAAWFATVPGVTDTGPYNEHLVRDVGAAYLTVAVCVGLALRRPTVAAPLLMAGSAFMVLHGLFHLSDSLAGRLPLMHLLTDLPGVLVPALVLPALAWWCRTEPTARSAP